jgi:hypothetical protein
MLRKLDSETYVIFFASGIVVDFQKVRGSNLSEHKVSVPLTSLVKKAGGFWNLLIQKTYVIAMFFCDFHFF